MSGLKLALIQMLVGQDKLANIAKAVAKVQEAAKAGAKLIVLPEFFNSPYGVKYFDYYAEPVPQGPTVEALENLARELKITLVGGSIPERSESKIYNTCPCFNKNGYIGKFRKMHLFDVDIKDRMVFHESESLSPGESPVILEHDKWKAGLGICYDVRFQEFGEYYVQNGCNLLIYPSAFNLTTGPAHWELMARARAVQSQCYVAMCSPARNTCADYVTWGYSMVVDPWGEVLAATKENEDVIYAEIDAVKVEEVRSMIPLRKQRRTDIYDTKCYVKPEII